MTPWDQRIARVLVRPLAATAVTPNQLTALSLAVALLGAGLLARGDATSVNVGAGVFVLGRFLDHFDGELARLTGRTSRVGYYFDYLAGALSYAALFACVGIGLAGGPFGGWALALGGVGAVSALVAMGLNLGIDAVGDGTEAIGYPAAMGFELEDGIYLIAPVTWVGLLPPFFVLAGVGAAVYLLWTLAYLLRLRARG